MLDTISDDKDLPRFVTKKWIEVYDQSEGNYNVKKEIRIKTPMLRSVLCDFSDAYIVLKGIISIENASNDAKYDRKLEFKNNAPFINCISKRNGVLIDNVEDLYLVMPMYNLLECSKNYRKASGNLWNYFRDDQSSGSVHDGNEKITISFRVSKSFEDKTTIAGSLDAGNLEKGDVEIVVPLKYLSSFWRSLEILVK